MDRYIKKNTKWMNGISCWVLSCKRNRMRQSRLKGMMKRERKRRCTHTHTHIHCLLYVQLKMCQKQLDSHFPKLWHRSLDLLWVCFMCVFMWLPVCACACWLFELKSAQITSWSLSFHWRTHTHYTRTHATPIQFIFLSVQDQHPCV